MDTNCDKLPPKKKLERRGVGKFVVYPAEICRDSWDGVDLAGNLHAILEIVLSNFFRFLFLLRIILKFEVNGRRFGEKITDPIDGKLDARGRVRAAPA
jgi:hypothetical protein